MTTGTYAGHLPAFYHVMLWNNTTWINTEQRGWVVEAGAGPTPSEPEFQSCCQPHQSAVTSRHVLLLRIRNVQLYTLTLACPSDECTTCVKKYETLQCLCVNQTAQLRRTFGSGGKWASSALTVSTSPPAAASSRRSGWRCIIRDRSMCSSLGLPTVLQHNICIMIISSVSFTTRSASLTAHSSATCLQCYTDQSPALASAAACPTH